MKKKQQSNKPVGDFSPYLNARREWNERYGSFIANANNWRLACLGSLAIAIIAVSGIVWISGQHKVVPYAVQLDSRGGVTGVSRAGVLQPNHNNMVAALSDWITGARTVYVDSRAGKAILDKTYAMTYPDSACYQTLATYHRDNNPYARAQKETVEVQINAVVPISGETWQVDWTETVKNRSGKILDGSPKQYQGTITTVIAPPTDEAQIMANPLGIYAQQCAWTTRLN